MIKESVLWYGFVECDIDVVKGVSVNINFGGWFDVIDDGEDVE